MLIIPSGGIGASASAYQSILNTAYSLTMTYQATGLAIALPSAGWYRISAKVRVTGGASSLWYSSGLDKIRCKFYNAKTSADVAGSEEANDGIAAGSDGQIILDSLIYVSAASTIQLWAVNNSNAEGTVLAQYSSMTYAPLSVGAIIVLPVVISFTPVYGESVSVTINGSGFTGATGVTFGGTPAASFTVISDSQIIATSPASFTAGVIAVTTAWATGTSSAAFAPVFTGYNATVLGTSGLQNYWRLDETSGTTFADSKGSLNGTWSGTFALGHTGATADAGDYSVLCGTSSNVAVSGAVTNGSANIAGGSMSIECLFKSQNISGLNMPIMGLWNSSSAGFNVKIPSAMTNIQWQFTNSAGTTITLTSTAPSFNAWHHCVMTYNSSTGALKGYIDGSLVVSGTASGTITSLTEPFYMAQNGASGSQWFSAGLLDNVAAYNVELSAAQVAAHYAAV
jgi:hypothetical protein